MCKYYKPNPLAATSVATSIGAFPLRKSEKYSLYVKKYITFCCKKNCHLNIWLNIT